MLIPDLSTVSSPTIVFLAQSLNYVRIWTRETSNTSLNISGMGLFEFVLDDFEPFTSSRKIMISGNAFAFEGSQIVFIFVFI